MYGHKLLTRLLKSRKMEWVLMIIVIILAGGGIKVIYDRQNRRDRDDEDKKDRLLKKDSSDENDSYQSCEQQVDIHKRPIDNKLEVTGNIIVQAMRSDIKQIQKINQEGLEKQEKERLKQKQFYERQEGYKKEQIKSRKELNNQLKDFNNRLETFAALVNAKYPNGIKKDDKGQDM